jgi:hypothetical protein
LTLAAIYLSRAGAVGSLRGGADDLNGCYAACGCGTALNIGVGPCWGEARGDMLEAMARIAPSQPNEAMARIAHSQPNEAMERIASRRNSTISLDPYLPGQNSQERFFRRRFKIVLEGSNRFEKMIELLGKSRSPRVTTSQSATRTHNIYYVQRSSDFCWIPL